MLESADTFICVPTYPKPVLWEVQHTLWVRETENSAYRGVPKCTVSICRYTCVNAVTPCARLSLHKTMTARASGRARENASNRQAASICIDKDRRPRKELLESHPWLLEYTMPTGSRLLRASYLLNKILCI